MLLALAFAVVEAAVVALLRAFLDPAGDRFPLVVLPAALLGIERAREVGTLLLLWTAAMLAARTAVTRFAAFLVVFGIWDLAYYAALRVLIGWPRRLDDWDLLFLVPVPWMGPVYAPCLVAVVMTLCGLAALHHAARRGTFVVRPVHVAAAALGGALVVASFVLPVRPGRLPPRYPAELLGFGLGIGLAGYADAWRRSRAPAPGRSSQDG